MFYKRLTLSDYLLTKDSGYTGIDIIFTSNVQIILGTNGSGKTVLMRQLALTSSPKSEFAKGGHKSLVVEHNDVDYRLEADYSKSSSPHLFFVGDDPKNRNEGGTTLVQNELIRDVMGITDLMNDLIMSDIDIPTWKAADRKDFFMNNNPSNLGFVLVETKNVQRQIKACKANLARLQDRKLTLEQEMLSEENIESLTKEQRDLTAVISGYQRNLIKLDLQLRTMVQTDPSGVKRAFNDVARQIRLIQKDLRGLGAISRDQNERTHRKEILRGTIASSKAGIESREKTIEEKSHHLIEMEERYNAIVEAGDLESLNATVERLEEHKSNLFIDKPAVQVAPEELTRLMEAWGSLRDLLMEFTSCPVPLPNRDKRRRRRSQLESYRYRHSSNEMTIGDLQSRLDYLSRRHKIDIRDIPSSPCAKDACPLYAHFVTNYEETEAERVSVKRRLSRALYRKGRLEQVIAHFAEYLDIVDPYIRKVRELLELGQKDPFLQTVLQSIDILQMLSVNPIIVAHRTLDLYKHMEQWYAYKSVCDELETAIVLRNRVASSESADTVQLVVSIGMEKKALSELRRDVLELSVAMGKDTAELSAIIRYEEIVTSTDDLLETFNGAVQSAATNHEYDRLSYLDKTIRAMNDEATTRLAEVGRILRSQDGLKERYTHEVVGEIAILEDDLNNLVQIEAALRLVPKEDIIEFINDVFLQANKIIDVVWTVPLSIVPLQLDDVLDYDFKIITDTKIPRPMGKCSDGQKEIIKLALNIALRINLGLTNLPICLDEAGRTFDEQHKRNLVVLLSRLLSDGIISQLIMINHHASAHEGFADREVLVLRDDNIQLPTVYNQHVVFS